MQRAGWVWLVQVGPRLGLASRPPQVPTLVTGMVLVWESSQSRSSVCFSVFTFYFMAVEAALAGTLGNRGRACSGGGSTGALPAWDPTL